MTVMPRTPFQVQKPTLATCSLTGCFGCHMSLLDIDERHPRIGRRSSEFDRLAA